MDKENLTEHERIVVEVLSTSVILNALINKLSEKGILTKDDRSEMMRSIEKGIVDALYNKLIVAEAQ